MSNFLNLVKIAVLEAYPRKGNKKSKFLPTILAYLCIAICIGAYLTWAFSLTNTSSTVVMSMVSLMITFLVFSQGIILLKGLYISKDFDMLEAMPLGKKQIVLSKLLSEYIIFLTYSVGIILPAMIYQVIKTNDYSILLNGILMSFISPIFPMFVSCVLATLFSYISAKSPKFGQVIDIVFNLITFVFVFSTSFYLSSQTNGNGDMTPFGGVGLINPTYYFVANSSGKPYFYLLYVLINVVLVLLITLIVAKVYKSMHILLESVRANKKYVRKHLDNKSELKTLIFLDLKRIFRSKTYILNIAIPTFLGLGMAIYGGVIIMLNKDNNDPEGLPFLLKNMPFLLPAFLIYVNNIFVVGQSLINFEAKGNYIVKTFPIDSKKYIKAKIIICLTHAITLNLLEAIIYIILVKPSLYDSLLITFIPLLVGVFENLFLLFINLTHPRFDYRNEQEMVKGGQIITIFSSLLMMFAIIVLYIVGLKTNIVLKILIPSIICLLYLTLNIIFYCLLINKSESAIKKF